MLDLVGARAPMLADIMEPLGKHRVAHAYVYSSGRSFHVYYPTLITHDEWVRFMGSALLLNMTHHAPVVDQRWVGHRLIGGYAALRWSCNTKTYRSMPERVLLA
jgi:hypothetical protein